MSSKKPSIEAKRHSLAHVLAQAVLTMFPEAKLGVGPAIENGFYYDFELPRTLIPEDLPLLEKKMKHIVKQNQKFTSKQEPVAGAIKFLKKIKQPYKVELANDFKKEGAKKLGFHRNGPFVDLCRGGHINATGDIELGSFALHKIAGAYWKGDETRPMLQRVYGLAFETKKELQEHLYMLKEAEKRDHRKLGKELDLFCFSELVGAGLPMFTPRGTIIRQAISDYLNELKTDIGGYQQVDIPHLAKVDLYKTSGHFDKFADDIFHVKGISEEFLIKPMNCPHHAQIYAARPRSYRDLPVRYAEITKMYRDEQSGELHGLSRVRSISIDDTHIFARPDQVEQEARNAHKIIVQFYKTIGINLSVRLSIRGDDTSKYLGKDADWKKAEKALAAMMKKEKKSYILGEGEAAFYGPKLDFIGKDSIGRTWQLSTIQIDFNQPERFALRYTDEKGKEIQPFMIHIAIAGSLERFMNVLIEHFAGAFPVWLAPVQVQLIPIAAPHQKAAEAIAKALKADGVRVEVAEPDDTLGKRIRNAELLKIPYMAVLGDKEVKSKKLNIREYKTGKQKEYSISAFTKKVKKEIGERSL